MGLAWCVLRRHVAQHWDEILLNVAFPIMCFSDEDQQLWHEDPHEYIRKVRGAALRASAEVRVRVRV